ncbi:MAG: zf-HC2 domain-containing protein [Pyrinomonadaceae bacterium]
MNCKDIQELLPLYVGHDLPAKRASVVATHLQSCVHCAGLEGEYRESRQLLQLFTPPPFSQGVYEGIRGRVLRQIEKESSAAPLPQLFSSLFQHRLGWAFATALLLAVSGFAFYFIANRQEQPQITVIKPTLNGTLGNEQPGAGPHGPTLAATPPLPDQIPAPPFERITRNAGPHKAVTHQPQRIKAAVASANRGDFVTVNSPDVGVMTTEASANIHNLTKPETIPAGDSTSAEKILRVEIQTKDRNIRIIWFSHQPTKQDFPNKSSEGI